MNKILEEGYKILLAARPNKLSASEIAELICLDESKCISRQKVYDALIDKARTDPHFAWFRSYFPTRIVFSAYDLSYERDFLINSQEPTIMNGANKVLEQIKRTIKKSPNGLTTHDLLSQIKTSNYSENRKSLESALKKYLSGNNSETICCQNINGEDVYKSLSSNVNL